jgi:hypothetical protein
LCHCCRFHWIITAQTGMETIRGDSRSTAFDRVWPHEEGTGGEVSLASIRKLTQRYWLETTSRSICLFLERFSTALSSRIVIFSDNNTVYRSPLTRNFIFWSKQNPHCLTEMEDHTPQVMIWRGETANHVIDPNFFDGTVIGFLYLETLRNYTRAYQQRHHGTGVVPAKWCSSSFHPDCACIPRPNPFANAMASTLSQLDHTP